MFENLDDEQKFSPDVELPHTKTKESFEIISGYLKWTKEADNGDGVKIVVDSSIILSSEDMAHLLVDS